ncbi:MAG: 1,4-alpha-glucan branching protein GlgB [Nitrospinae bacterium]|nr:1,4-alpha-glucan branching protein GlgB [Nitrospinota bacterium]
MSSTAAPHDIERIIHADHHDPFSVLGIHPVKGGVAVRAFNPEAAEMAVVELHNRENRWGMERIHDAGFFEVFIPNRQVFAYDLHLVTWRGEVSLNRDPYSFLPLIGEMDLYLFNEGNHYEIHKRLGAHVVEVDGMVGVRFAVWAPGAQRVSVVGPFCEWDGRRFPMRVMGGSGVWELFIPGMGEHTLYKFEIKGVHNEVFLKADPYAYASELRPKSASVVWDHGHYLWGDDDWVARRRKSNPLTLPMSVYEVHLGSWARSPDGAAWLSYRELAPRMAEYCKTHGYTHIELLPVSEFPFDGSWGYQVTGYFSPTCRFGDPDDFKYFVDFLHNHDVGVIVDWVPAHFPKDEQGLRMFTGQPVYEHPDPRRGEHKDWGTLIFDYGRPEVANFLISSALFWIEYYHLDGIRVDAVASMLYLDYSREPGEWTPNQYGGNENLDAIEFLRKLNIVIHEKFPGVVTVAEESTSFPAVSRPVYLGGLGFTMKWNMGWMHDMLEYFAKDPVYRKYHHSNLTFAMLYAFTENFVLPLSHDEMVHGKGSMLDKMPGDDWQKFANLRALYAYMYAFPGKKLLFQGADFGQRSEWKWDASLDWHLLRHRPHARQLSFFADLANLYRREPAFWEVDDSYAGFDWIDCNDHENSTISFLRKGKSPGDHIVCVFNLTPVPRYDYRLGVPERVWYAELLNSDSEIYGGSNMGNLGGAMADDWGAHGRPHSLRITLPPLSALYFKPVRG